MSKHKQQRRNEGGLVYSTDPDYLKDRMDEAPSEKPRPTSKEDLRIHLLRHKGNKVATVIRGWAGNAKDLEALGKLLKQKCGSGGAVKDWEIILQGDHRQLVADLLTKEGHRHKFAGG